MKLLKKSLILTSFALIFVLAVTFVFSGFINNRQSLAIRSVNVNEIGTLSYEEKAEKLKEKFSSINTAEDNNAYYFCGEINIDACNLLSTNYEGQEVKEKYYSTIDKSDESITIEKDVVVNNEVKSTILENYTTRYDEQTEKYYLIDENGNEIDIFAELEDDNVNECFALAMFFLSLSVKELIAICVVTAISIEVIAKADTIANNINSLVSGVRDGFISFWDKIKLALGKITAIPLKESIALTSLLAQELYEIAKNRKDCYILCGTITGTGFIPIKYKFTNYENARNWIKKGGSVWSPFSSTAEKCITGAGYIPMVEKNKTPRVYEAERHQISFTVNNQLIEYGFYHYHAGNKKTLKKINFVHSFFGLPFGN